MTIYVQLVVDMYFCVCCGRQMSALIDWRRVVIEMPAYYRCTSVAI